MYIGTEQAQVNKWLYKADKWPVGPIRPWTTPSAAASSAAAYPSPT